MKKIDKWLKSLIKPSMKDLENKIIKLSREYLALYKESDEEKINDIQWKKAVKKTIKDYVNQWKDDLEFGGDGLGGAIWDNLDI